MEIQGKQYPDLLTSGEVAELFRVDPKTPPRWARLGVIDAFRLPSGHLRYPAAGVAEMLNGDGSNRDDS